jgi:glycosyltransferase involved in cell wall biosynthesis
MSTPSKILFIHLYNNFTGSPNVLSNIINELKKEHSIILVTNRVDGFLSNIHNIEYNFYTETTIKHPFIKWFIYQVRTGIKVWKHRNETTIIYCNTIYPLGAGLIGKLLNKKVIYHLHEVTITPIIFRKFAVFCVGKIANRIIVVSNFVKSYLLFSKNTIVIPNSIGNNFLQDIEPHQRSKRFTILMLSSLNVKNKGIDTFIKLCKLLPTLHFELVISDAIENIENELGKDSFLIKNLTIHSTQKNTHQFYKKAHLLLNLSNPNFFIETFGLTVLEGMYYGLPAIVPNIGGITDLVNNGINGYCVDTSSVEVVKNIILAIKDNKELYEKLSNNALKQSVKYSTSRVIEDLKKNLRL